VATRRQQPGWAASPSSATQLSLPALFTIPLADLPADEVLSGPDNARFGVADILVFSDDNENGVFDVTAHGAAGFVDRVAGASRTLDIVPRVIRQLVYREGELSALWKVFGGVYGCPAPPQGFSTLTFQVELPEEYLVVTGCTISDDPLLVEMSGRAEKAACVADPETRFALPATTLDAWPAGAVSQCYDFGNGQGLFLVVEPDSVCPIERLYAEGVCAGPGGPQL
jgi:hypothetical protein